jgi:GNAT superfamily N-acetyltransferase
MRSGPERFDSADAVRLAEAQQAEMLAQYGEGGNDIGPAREASQFEPPYGVFLVVRDEDGEAVACGGVVRFDATRAELKRMYVLPEARGLGLGRRVLQELEAEARRLGYAGLVLETGDRSAAALSLYRSSGYKTIPCYGVYAHRGLSRCLEKRLS